MSYSIKTYLFNAPFLSAFVPIQKIKNEKLKFGIHFAKNLVKAGIAAAIKDYDQRAQQDDAFNVLSTCLPYLLVNPADHVCLEYIRYFEHRKKMEDISAWKNWDMPHKLLLGIFA